MTTPRLRHVPALDGLRGLAVLAVLLFHDGRLPGGFLGVDLFFVLSGYLITSLLVAEWEVSGRIDLRAFWTRRATRLLPASVAMLTVVASALALSGDLARLRGQLAASVFQVANWYAIVSAHDYWDLFKTPSPFDHMWSLGIEEQFYFVWPLVTLGVLTLGKSRRWLQACCVVLIALSCWRFDVAQAASHSRAYFGTDTRAQALLIGALVACSKLAMASRRRSGLLALVGLAILVAAARVVDGESPLLYRGGMTAFAMAMAVLIGALASSAASSECEPGKSRWRAAPVATVLTWHPLTALGKISYGVYLWHWPVFCWLSTTHPEGNRLVALTFLRMATTLAIALLSYWLIEQPLRTQRLPRYAHRHVVVALLIGCVATVKAVSSFASPHPPVVALAPPVLPAADVIAEPIELQLLLLGDSTANSLGWGLRDIRKPGLAVELRGQDGCTMLADTCGGESWVQRAKDVRADTTLVFLGGAFLHGVSVDRQWRKACHRGWDDPFERTLAKRLAELGSADGDVWAVTVPYALGVWDTAAFRAEVDCINVATRKAARSAGVKVLELATHLCPDGVCVREVGGVIVRPDGVHFSMEGATSLAPWVLEQVMTKDPPPGRRGGHP